MICPECGSENISVDVDLDPDNDYKFKREYQFCFDCGHEWDIVHYDENENVVDGDGNK